MEKITEDQLIKEEIADLVRETDRDTFRSLVKGAIKNSKHQSGKKVKVIIWRSMITSLAAFLLLFFFVYNPVERYKIRSYLNQSTESVDFPVIDANNSVRGNVSGPATISYKKIRFIESKGLDGHYFIREGVIYLPSNCKQGKLLRQINEEGQMEYFYNADFLKIAFRIDFGKENRISKFDRIEYKQIKT
jgi:hypothetical protein